MEGCITLSIIKRFKEDKFKAMPKIPNKGNLNKSKNKSKGYIVQIHKNMFSLQLSFCLQDIFDCIMYICSMFLWFYVIA